MAITQEQVRKLFDYRDGNLYCKVSNSNRVKIGDRVASEAFGRFTKLNEVILSL